MSYLLDGNIIKRPKSLTETNDTQTAQNRGLSGAITRDHFGANKRVWAADYENVSKTDYDTINTVYQTYLTTSTPVTWEVTETNYTVSSTTVHIDLKERKFGVGGTDYISDFALILSEA